MEDLIKALTIFAKYTDSKYPTYCEHDVLYVYVSPVDVSKEDIAALKDLDFLPSIEDENFYSYRFGS